MLFQCYQVHMFLLEEGGRENKSEAIQPIYCFHYNAQSIHHSPHHPKTGRNKQLEHRNKQDFFFISLLYIALGHC